MYILIYLFIYYFYFFRSSKPSRKSYDYFRLLTEVFKRPIIHDSNLVEFYSNEKKRRMWYQIAEIMSGKSWSGMTDQEKKRICK